MSNNKVRTRYAPSPTGFMHVGNLRTALYEYLIAKSQDGTFVLRIEDTDQERYVEGAVDVIYDTLKLAGLKHDEGPDVGGDYGPYVQSERKNMYVPYAEQLIKEGKIKRSKKTATTSDSRHYPFDLPSGWVWCRLGEINAIARGWSPRPIKNYITDDPNGVNWIKIGDTTKNSKYIET